MKFENPNDANEEVKTSKKPSNLILTSKMFKEFNVENLDKTPKQEKQEDQKKDWSQAPEFLPAQEIVPIPKV